MSRHVTVFFQQASSPGTERSIRIELDAVYLELSFSIRTFVCIFVDRFRILCQQDTIING